MSRDLASRHHQHLLLLLTSSCQWCKSAFASPLHGAFTSTLNCALTCNTRQHVVCENMICVKWSSHWYISALAGALHGTITSARDRALACRHKEMGSSYVWCVDAFVAPSEQAIKRSIEPACTRGCATCVNNMQPPSQIHHRWLGDHKCWELRNSQCGLPNSSGTSCTSHVFTGALHGTRSHVVHVTTAYRRTCS
jgi:hypothetical protein